MGRIGFLLLLSISAHSKEDVPIDLILNDPFTVNAPTNNCDYDICKRLLALINSSTESVDFAIYGIRKQSAILQALINAQARGVRVRGVVDSDIQGQNYYSDTALLQDKLSLVRTDHQSDLVNLKKKRD